MINGINYSAENVQVIMFGAPRYVTKISYTLKQTKENNYGLDRKPRSRGYGAEEYECSIDIMRDDWVAIVDAAPDKNPCKIPPFDFQVIYSGDSVNYKEDHLQFAEFREDPLAVSSGDTKIVITVPMIIGGIMHL